MGLDLLSEGASRRDGSHSSVSRSRTSRSSGSSSSRSSKKWDVEELEMLLEAYFVQIEGTLNKLSSVSDALRERRLCCPCAGGGCTRK